MTVIDAAGKFIMPGLIDTNVHLSLYGGVGERYETLAKYHPRQQEIVLEAAQLQLKHGVTTVRDSYGLLMPLVAVREQIQRGEAIGSRILAAGNIVGWGGPYSDQLQPDSRAGPDVVPGTDERRGLAGRRRGSGRHGSRGAARRRSARISTRVPTSSSTAAPRTSRGRRSSAFPPEAQKVIVDEAHRAQQGRRNARHHRRWPAHVGAGRHRPDSASRAAGPARDAGLARARRSSNGRSSARCCRTRSPAMRGRRR